MMEKLSSSETLVLITATRRNISEDAILHSHHRENLKSYISSRIRGTDRNYWDMNHVLSGRVADGQLTKCTT
jgi:uncharacterized protein (DUF1015 family)